MELQTVKVESNNKLIIPNGTGLGNIGVKRSGIAKVLWHKLNVEIPVSEIIANGVNIHKD